MSTDVLPPYVSILAPSFHGATTLSVLLNNHPQLVSLGDNNPPRRFEHHNCTCGLEIRYCEFWAGLQAELAEFSATGSDAWFPTRPNITGRFDRTDSLLVLALQAAGAGGVVQSAAGRLQPFREFRRYLSAFARHVLVKSGKGIFVDGEKSVTKYVAANLSGYHPKGAIHLIRDPRAYVASSIRIGSTLDASAAEWRRYHRRLLHATARGPVPILRLHYEALTTDPVSSMKLVFNFLGVAHHDIFFRPTPEQFWHQTGNRTVLQFNGYISDEEKWRHELSAKQSARVLRLAGSLARDFGYL